ncbi:glycoside hydrolase family 3 N-terminal domain-containing protein [Paenibacillus thermotolerans]|uniref:glycoside hydrolase family 3 N-terminal domain-containing protein n=1 Tax=Paenibacillus thermotolerans TaxID=3027807 RepID=UPI002367CEA7|nr:MULTISPECIES: glycoside hydrolase family 3 N-terminal domain-containing protein [unclassified Paenibacillus]
MNNWQKFLAKLCFAGMVVFLAIVNVPGAEAAQRFTDLQNVSWAADDIHYLADRGTVAGYGSGSFKPLTSITRAQAVTYLVRELYPEATPSAERRYPDVPGTHMFHREIIIASDMGLAGGLPDGSFKPDAPISRAETVALLSRAYDLSAGNRQAKLRDIEGHWAEASIRLLASNGLVGGYSDGSFRPNRAVNRAEYAVFLSRVIQFKREQAIEAQDWDQLLSLMTLEEKAGQMLMPDIRMWQNKPTITANAGIASTVRDHRLGGLILFEKNITDMKQMTTLNHNLQELAGDIPLFLGIDQEGGVIKRIPGGTNLPGAMALGATRNSALSFEAGKVTGAELKALGVNLDFAPVLDVNVNPDNPIIGIRSFGSDPGLVSKLGVAFLKGLKQESVISAVKHFPGHGDTIEDSHLGLPVVAHDRGRLEQVELRPFREAIEQGADMIMTAHVAFPAIEDGTVRSKKDGSSISLPATLSRKVVTGLLRDELGFQGVVISDAFTMNGIAQHFGEEEAVVRAISAGVDIVLMPRNITDAFDAIVRAVKTGELQEQQLDASVKRILRLKHKYGLFAKPLPLPLQSKLQNVQLVVGSASHRAIERRIAEAAVTALNDGGGRLAYQISDGDVVAVVAPNASQAQLIESLLKGLGLPRRFSVDTVIQGEASQEETARAITRADFVIAASYQFRSPLNKHNWPDYQALIHDLNTHSKPYVLLSLGNPYELIFLRDVSTALAVYGAEEPNISAGLRVIFGQSEAPGTLPVGL